jgi:hypothetical protein
LTVRPSSLGFFSSLIAYSFCLVQVCFIQNNPLVK